MTVWTLQGIRFVIVGLVSNIVLFVCYLLLTAVGLAPKLAMTAMFALGTMQTFFANKLWTFGHQGLLQASFFKYVAVYVLAYLLNLAALMVLVDSAGYPHQIVQGMMILILAVMIFLLQKFWVFRTPQGATSSGRIRNDGPFQ